MSSRIVSPRRLIAALACVLAGLPAACGSGDDFAIPPPPVGAEPSILTQSPDTYISYSGAALDGSDTVFRINYGIRGYDADADMRKVLITIFYTESCGNVPVSDTFIEDVPGDLWPLEDIFFEGAMTSQMRVPTDCFATDNEFTVVIRLQDFYGNLSNPLRATLTVSVGQGG